MSVVIETTLGDITVDLYLDQRPVTCLNFLKLCKIKYYNYNLFHTIRSDFIAQTGDPTGEGTGGESIWGVLEGPQKRFFSGEKMPKIRHTGAGLLSMVCTDEMMVGSQFFFTLAPDLDSLDGVHCVIGEVTEGHEVLTKLNEVICDETNRPYRDVRITHTVVLEDPFNDPPGLRAPSRSPSPNTERLKGGRIAPDEEIDETQGKSMVEVQEMIEEKEAKARATILEIVGDLPDADIAPPENVLFVCKLNPVTTDDDLEIIFSRFGKIVSCEVIKDKKTGNSLQYAFIEFENKKSCEDAYFKMDNVLIDDRRIHVDFSQSVSKMRYLGKGRGVQYLNDEVITNPEIRKRGDTSKPSHTERKKYDREERDDPSRRRNHDRRHYENEKSEKSRHNDRRQYDQKKNDESSKQRQNKNEEDNRAKMHHNDRRREDVPRKQYNDREKDDLSKRNHHDQRLDEKRSESKKVKNYREESEREKRNNKNETDTRGRYERDRENKNVYKSRSRSHSRNRSSERLTKNGDHRDRRNYELERYDRNHKHTNKRDMSSSSKKDKSERSPQRQKDTDSQETFKNKKHHALEKNRKSSGEEERQKLKNKEHKSKDRHESNKKTTHNDSRTPSPDYKKKERSTRKDKGKTTSKKTTSERKHKKSTSSDSDTESSSSSSTSSSSSDSDKKKSKARRRKRKHSSSSSSDSSSSSSTSSDSSDSSSSSSDSEPRKKRVKNNKNKSSTKNSKK